MNESPRRPWTSDRVSDPAAQGQATYGKSVVEGWPDDPDVRLREIVDDINHTPGFMVFAAEYDHYGSGYASYVEVKITRSDESLVDSYIGGVSARGFGLLLSRLAPIASLQSTASQQRSDGFGSESVPSSGNVCGLPVPYFPETSALIGLLARHGYEVADPVALDQPLSPDLNPSTNLGDPPWTVFDAWFYWYD